MNLVHSTRPVFFFFLTLLCLPFFAFSQYTDYGQNTPQSQPPPMPASHAIYTELGGPGMVLSLNYDTRLTRRKGGLGIRAGIGSSFGNDPSFLSVPVGLNYLAGHGGNFFELGAGTTFVNIANADFNHRFSLGGHDYQRPAHFFLGNAVIGYRYQPTHGGLNVRTGVSPYFGGGSGGLIPYFSLGYNF